MPSPPRNGIVFFYWAGINYAGVHSFPVESPNILWIIISSVLADSIIHVGCNGNTDIFDQRISTLMSRFKSSHSCSFCFRISFPVFTQIGGGQKTLSLVPNTSINKPEHTRRKIILCNVDSRSSSFLLSSSCFSCSSSKSSRDSSVKPWWPELKHKYLEAFRELFFLIADLLKTCDLLSHVGYSTFVKTCKIQN